MFTVVVTDAVALKGVDDSVPLTDAASVRTVPADDVTCVETETVQVCPAPRLAALQVTCPPL
jgi:hypothetical protein